MFVVTVSVHVTPGREQEFIEATARNHAGAIAEPGCVRFDVLRVEGDPTRFTLYEVYRDREAQQAHQRTPHYLAWREAVAGLMAEPRQAVRHDSMLPSDQDF